MGRLIRAFAFFVLLFWADVSWAACTVPAGGGLALSFVNAHVTSKSETSVGEGYVIYDTTAKEVQYCDGANWISLLSDTGASGGISSSGPVTAGQGFETPQMRLGFYHYNSGGGAADTGRAWLHLKTNIPMTNQMQMIEFKGYEYKPGLPIDARIAFYAYDAPNDIYRMAVDGTHSLNAYKSADGFAVIAINIWQYYVGFVLNQYGANPTGLFPMAITATSWTTSDAGAY